VTYGTGAGRGSSGHRFISVVLLAAFAAVASVPALGLAQTAEPPPPTPVPVPGGGTSPSPFPRALRTPAPEALDPPEIAAAAAILVEMGSGQTLYALAPAERRPVASLTKIMTAYLVLAEGSLSDVVTVSERAADVAAVGISGLGLEPGERISVRDLLYGLLLQSANDAAVALAEHVAGSEEAFVERMNETALGLGLTRTRFASPNGLDNDGYSTAREMARLTRAAFGLEEFAQIVATVTHRIPAPDGSERLVTNRNALLWLYPGATGVKTGFTTPAGFCIVASAERGDRRLLAVVLGEPREAFSDAAALMNFGFAAFEWRPLIRRGRALGAVTIDGRDVAVAAGGGLTALVPVQAQIRRRVLVDPVVRYPPGRGQTIGRVIVSVESGREVGSVPLVVTDVPPPPPLLNDRPWWWRGAEAVVKAGTSLVEALLS
jgi:D-alanyl-D-alanine carboxypeptidase (penicillin-binding protein 5/6)